MTNQQTIERLTESRDQAKTPYVKPDCVESLREQATAAGRRWMQECASHHELQALRQAVKAGVGDFSRAFTEGALEVAAEIGDAI